MRATTHTLIVLATSLTAIWAGAAEELRAQQSTPVTPVDVYLACRHRAAQTDPTFRKLCTDLRIPPPGAEFTSTHFREWFGPGGLSLPSSGSVDEAAREVREGATETLRIVGLLDSIAAPELSLEDAQAKLDSAQRFFIAGIAGEIRRQMQPGDSLIVRGVAYDASGAVDPANKVVAGLRANLIRQELIALGVDSTRIRVDTVVVQTANPARQAVSRGVLIDLVMRSSNVTRATHAFRVRRSELAGLPVESAPPALPNLAGQTQDAFSLNLTSIATGATDVLLERAGEQLQVYVMDLVGDRICPATGPDTEWETRLARWQQREAQFDAIRERWRQEDLRLGTDGPGPALVAQRSRTIQEFERDRRAFDAERTRYERRRARSEGRSFNVGAYLPQTCGFFRSSFELRQLRGPRAFRAAFAADIRWIPELLLAQALQVRLQEAAVKPEFRDAAQAALFTLYMVQEIEQGADPLKAFSEVAQHSGIDLRGIRIPLTANVETPISTGVLRLANFAQEVAAARGGISEYWNGEAIAADTLYTYALRALAVNYRENPVMYRDLILRAQPLLDAHREVETAMRRISDISERLRNLDQVGGEDWPTRRRELYNQLLAASFDIGAAALRVDTTQLATVRALVPAARSLVVAARTGEYSQALHGFTELLDVLVQRMGNQAGLIAFPAQEWEHDAFKILSLAVNVSEARSQEEVNNAFRSFVGQSRDFFTKREGNRSWRVAVNAYVGAGFGGEFAESPTPDNSDQVGGHLSLTVPIGVELSRGTSAGRSHSFFLSLVDLGAIASVRLGGDEIETLPETEVSRIFTPGLHYVLGVAGAPFSIGMGVTVAPGGREWTVANGLGGTETRSGNAIRFGFFGGIDIPIFP